MRPVSGHLQKHLQKSRCAYRCAYVRKVGFEPFGEFFSGITYEYKGVVDGIPTYAVSGSPGDCVLFGVKYLFKDEKIDAVVSGINTCLNAGSDIIFSGTFGAAQEGTFQRIPSLAVSLRTHGVEDYEFAAEFAATNLEKLLSFASENVTINLNIPCVKKRTSKA